ncbi:MAG: antitoxin [Spirochaetes bacterium]|jgi:predicted DNA binding CopG/RHH family protein|nr:antitoxin [Spirochaetota bacterium]
MSERYDPEYVDEEEKELIEQLDDLDTGALERPSRQRQNELREAAREHLKNRATKMNIRIDAEELERIKRQAEKEGLRYQTLIKSVLHKYVTGQLVERDEKAG